MTKLDNPGQPALTERCKTLQAENQRLQRQNDKIREANQQLTRDLEQAERDLSHMLGVFQRHTTQLAHLITLLDASDQNPALFSGTGPATEGLH